MEPYIGEIIMFGGNFAPRGWAFCEGQLLAVSSNTALFSILGTTYGGDGRTTFGLPDLRGRAPMQQGTGPGLSPRGLGQKGGSETNTLLVQNLPAHAHPIAIPVSHESVDTDDPSGGYITTQADDHYASSKTNGENYGSFNSGNNASNNTPVNNMQPWLAVNFIIALVGVYPSRS